MKEWQSLAHVRWECKYHVVFVPKYRKKVMYGRTRKRVGQILRQLCRQKGVECCLSDYSPARFHDYSGVRNETHPTLITAVTEAGKLG